MTDTPAYLPANDGDDVSVGRLWIDGDVADSLAGQAEAFGKGIAGERIVIESADKGRVHTAEYDFAIRFVAYQENVVTVLLLFAAKNIGKAPEGIRGIYDAGGIVGSIDQNCGDIFSEHFLKSVEINLEILCVGGNDLEDSAGLINILGIFREERREGQHLVAGNGDAADGMGNSAGSTASHKDMPGLIACTEAAVKALCHSLPDGRNAE